MPTRTMPDVDPSVRCAGDGPPLLLIHGLGSSSEDWEPQLDPLAGHFTVRAPDLRGHGRARAADGPYTVEQFAADMEALIGSLRAGPVRVVGISLGASVALELASRAPALVERLVLVNGLPDMVARGFGDRLKILERLLLVRTCSMVKLGKILAYRVFPGDAQADLRESVARRFAANDKQVYQQTLRSLLRWSIRSRLASIATPTLVVASELDYTPVEAKQVFIDSMPRAELVVIPGAHHAVPLECPAAFNACVLPFLTGRLRHVGYGKP